MSWECTYSAKGVLSKLGGGTSKELEERVAILESHTEELEGELNAVKNNHATTDSYGLARISRSTGVTEDNGLVLGASEKNAAIQGSLAAMIEEAKKPVNIESMDAPYKSEVITFANSVAAKRGFYPITTGGGVSGNNVPGGSYGYSTGFVISRGNGTIIIVLFNRGDGGNNEIAAVNARYNNANWNGWKYIKYS